MLPPIQAIIPCIILLCMNGTPLGPQPIRCYHTNSGSCTHQDDDGCSNFTVPSVTRSKIGAVLHLAFRLESGDVHYVDIDINLPSITASNSDHYDGSTHCSGREVYIGILSREMTQSLFFTPMLSTTSLSCLRRPCSDWE